MSECAITTSVFSAGANSPSGVPKGWLAEAADQLVNGKRYVGIDATAAATDPSLNTTRGHISNIIHDCANDCEVYGSMFSRTSDGLLKTRAQVVVDAPCETPCQASALRLRITVLTDIFPCTQEPSGIYTLTPFGCGGDGSDCCFIFQTEPPIWQIIANFVVGGSGVPTCLWARFGVFPTCLGTYGSDVAGNEPNCAASPGTRHAQWFGRSHSYRLWNDGVGGVLARITDFEFIC